MEKIGDFLSEYGEMLLIGLPVFTLLGILFGVFIKMLIKNPKSMLGALFTVLGIIALYLAVGLLIEEKHWEKVAMVFLGGVPAVYCFYRNPKLMLKIVLTALAIVAVLVAIGYFFGIAIAFAVGINGIFLFMTHLPVKWLMEYSRLEKYGLRTEGEILSIRSIRGGKIPTFGFTTLDGTYVKQEISDVWSNRAKKLHETFTLIYDPDDPQKVCAGKYTLIGLIVYLMVFLAFDAAILAVTIIILMNL